MPQVPEVGLREPGSSRELGAKVPDVGFMTSDPKQAKPKATKATKADDKWTR